MASSSSSSSSFNVPRKGWTYDVFLSFRGEDTHNNFVDHLYAALVQEGIRVFKGDEMQPISEDVVKDIKESGFAVVVFTENYTSSSLCLEEISTIMECHDQMGQKVLPVFYHADPSDICVQVEGEVDKVKKWRDALTAATNLPKLHISPNNTGESAFVKEIVGQILEDVEISERKIVKLFVSDKEIGRESNGTVVLEGTYYTRPVAVKRVVKEHPNVASKEIQKWINSDHHHPNIVGHYGVEYDQDFVYIAMEHCICSLQEFIFPPTNPTVQLKQLTLEFESFKLLNGYPSPELLKVMRDTIAGLAHLHELGIVHQDLKPQNVLICKYSSISAKISLNIAAGYGSSPGWQAPEILLKPPQTNLFSLGCLLFFCITGGHHPFGDDIYECDTNIKEDRKDLSLVDNIPEAFDLVSNLIHRDPESRPSAAEVYHHPLFWDPDTRLSFLLDASDRVELEDRETSSYLLKALERIGSVVLDGTWDNKLDSTLLGDIDSLRDLLRVIRNKFNDYRELPKDVQAALGDVPTGFEGYFRSRFPKLLMEVYKVLKLYCGKEECLKKYYKKRNEAARVHKVGKITFNDEEIIGQGSNGTIVMEGMYKMLPVAVKRIVKVHHDDNAFKEVDHLLASDRHPNIVRYYDVESHQGFVYIALERCICNLHELILPPTNPTVQFQQLTLLEVESFKVREPIGYPSSVLLNVMRDAVAGLAHLHKLRIIHRDLRPQNVLICKYSSISAKVSDMGISKCLSADKSSLTSVTGYGSSGWQAPELFHEKPQITLAVDLFSLGCLLFFCITGGGHPFGDDNNRDRDTNIMKDNCKDLFLVDNIPEVFDLVSKLIHPKPESRPSAAEVYHHPLFWDPETCLSFFRDASDFVELEYRLPNSVLRTPLESIGKVVFGSKWDDKLLDSNLLKELETFRGYTYTSVRDLLRVIRNTLNHYRQLSPDVKAVFGNNVPRGLVGYFRKYPKLLIEVYKVLKQRFENEESLKKYFKTRVD